MNIDAMPGSMESFTRVRPRDTNIEAAISNNGGFLHYYMFNEPALNCFSAELAAGRDGLSWYKVQEVRQIETITLEEVLDRHLPTSQAIDFLNVDVEGMDLEVLQSNNWIKHRPRVVLTEDLERTSLDTVLESPVATFMRDQGYSLSCKTVLTLIFELKAH